MRPKISSTPAWRLYERFVAKLMADEAKQHLTVIPNARLIGRISGVRRQIDVLIDSRHGDDLTRRIIVDAKRRKRPINVKQVEEFEGMMKDVQAQQGVIVCLNGNTPAALKRAQHSISIRLVRPEDLDALNVETWDPCSHLPCRGLVLWDATPSLDIDGVLTIFGTGKCDECRRFNVWCWACAQRFALDDEDERQCSCNGDWFWLTAIEDESDDQHETLAAVYLLLIYDRGRHVVVDRRPLR